MLCWLEIELFRDLEDHDRRVEAERIFEKYITHGSVMEVHIRPDVRRRLQGNVYHGEARVDVFEEVQQELFDLMNSEFPRFLASEQCRACLQVQFGLHST